MKIYYRLLILVLIGWIAVSSWWYLCKIKGLCVTGPKVVELQKLIIDLEDQEEMNFNVSSNADGVIQFQNLTPGQSVGQAAGFLLDNPDKNLSIISQHQEVIDALIATYNIVGVGEDRISYSLVKDKNAPTYMATIDNPSYFSNDTSLIDSTAVTTIDEQPIAEQEVMIILNEIDETTATMPIVPDQLPIRTPSKKPVAKVPCPNVNTSSTAPSISPILFTSSSYGVYCPITVGKFAKAAVAYINTYGGTIKITGHTDSDKKSLSNVALGLKRASEIKKILIKNGVPANKITTYSKGDTQPVADNSSIEGKKLNSRVTIELY